MKYFIIPGIGGSKIYCNCGPKPARLYPSTKFNFNSNLSPHFFEQQKCVVKVKPFLRVYRIVSIYATLVRRLGAENCTVYAYDWRSNPLTIAQEIAKELTNLIAKGSCLIGHSNGGLIIRIMLEYLGVDRKRFSNIFICGTPLFGSVNKFMYNHEDDVFLRLIHNDHKVQFKPSLLSDSDVERIFKRYRETLIFYIPSYRLAQLLEGHVGAEIGVDAALITVVAAIHRKLALMGMKQYHIYFNVHKTIKLKREFSSLDNQQQIIPIMKSLSKNTTTTTLVYKLKSDSLVIPTNHVPPNNVLIYDTTPLSHSLIMNSQFLIDLIKKPIM